MKLTSEGIVHAESSRARKPELSDVQRIAQAVKRYASKQIRPSFEVLSIITLARVERRIVQAVQIEMHDEVFATHTPVTIVPQDGGSYVVVMLGQDSENGILFVSMVNEVTSFDLPAVLRLDPAFLIHQLAEAIETLDDIPLRAQALLGEMDRGFRIAKEDSGDVADMIAVLKPPWTRFLWGPPGEGKTYAIGRMMTQLLMRDADTRILLVAPSNSAADVALEQFIAQLEQTDQRSLPDEHKILRYGYRARPNTRPARSAWGSCANRD